MSQKSTSPNPLPAMPKLRPRPDLKPEPSAEDFILDQDLEEEETIPPPSMKRPRLVSDIMCSEMSLVFKDGADKTSRLLTKNDCRGGRKRNSGSLIHSIPKFTQVQPRGGCMSEVQKVLQTRLLEKLQRQNSEGSDTSKNTSKSETSHQLTASKLEATFQAATKPETTIRTTTTSDPQRSANTVHHFPQFKASNILQNIVHLHEKAAAVGHVTSPTIERPTVEAPPSGIYFSNFRKRGRKRDKSEICHLVSVPEPKDVGVSLSEIILPQSKTNQPSKEEFSLPNLSEVTITPAIRKFSRSPSPDIVEIPVSKMTSVKYSPPSITSATSITTVTSPAARQPVLKPDEYESQGMPSGYIFWPSANVFVHYSAIPPQYLDYRGLQPTNSFSGATTNSASPPTTSITSSATISATKVSSPPTRKVDSMESLTGVMRVKPFKATAHQSPMEKQQPHAIVVESNNKPNARSLFKMDPNNEVSICKFKFTGGEKPTLEEKKMLSVDSGGNFRYFSGNQPHQQQPYTTSPSRPNNNNNGSSFETAVSMTSDRLISKSNIGLTRRQPLGAVDLISAFEALPERPGIAHPVTGSTSHVTGNGHHVVKRQ